MVFCKVSSLYRRKEQSSFKRHAPSGTNLTYRTDNEEQKVNEVESDRRFGGCFPVALDA